MKKSTSLLCVFALFSSTLMAETVQVTTAEMNAATEGSLLQVMANIPDATETIIEFNFDGETLEYNTEDCKGFDLAGKTVKFDGLNKKNGNPVTIVGGANYFLNLSGESNVSIENLIVKGFTAIAFKMSGNCTFSASKCQFIGNRDPKNEKGNNGGVARINNCNATFDQCYFYNNKCSGDYGGGALCFYTAGAPAPKLRVTNCTFEYNEAVSGGAIGINVLQKGVVPEAYIANCTFANNTCFNRGGALYMQANEKTGSFAPVVVNCTFVGNLNEITTSDDGGAINVWARTSSGVQPMKPVFINNLFAENYYDPWVSSALNDVKAFYLEGDVSGGTEQPQSIIAVCKNNYFAAANDKFYQVLGAADNNGLIDFSNDVIFAAVEQNPWDDGDSDYSHMTATLSGDLRVAMIAENSVVIGKGLKTYEGIEIPTTDQLGKTRPDAPAVGAVEYSSVVSVIQNALKDGIRVWNDGNVVYASGLEGEMVAKVYNLTGELVYEGVIADQLALNLPVENGIYVMVIGKTTHKLVIR